jgi:hypothetical protein
MTTTAIGSETEKRTLESDDKKGYCALDLPEFECADKDCMCPTAPVFRSKPETHTCSCRTAGAQHAGAPLVPLALSIGALLLRMRTRTRRRRAVNGAPN